MSAASPANSLSRLGRTSTTIGRGAVSDATDGPAVGPEEEDEEPPTWTGGAWTAAAPGGAWTGAAPEEEEDEPPSWTGRHHPGGTYVETYSTSHYVSPVGTVLLVIGTT